MLMDSPTHVVKKICLSINSNSKEIQVDLSNKVGIHNMQCQRYMKYNVLHSLPGIGL